MPSRATTPPPLAPPQRRSASRPRWLRLALPPVLALTVGATGVGTASATTLPASADAPTARTSGGSFFTSFEPDDPQPTWDSETEQGPGGPRSSGVVGTTVLERSPSTPVGDNLLGGATDTRAWEGPFQNGVGNVPGTLEPTSASGDTAMHWAMQSAGETWVQVPMPNLVRGVPLRAQVTLSGSGTVFLNVYDGSRDVGGEEVALSATPKTVTVDVARPSSGGGTPQFQVRTHSSGKLDVTIADASVQQLKPGTIDFPGDITDTVAKVTASGENPPDEVAANLSDGKVSTKWLTGSRTPTVTYQLKEPAAVATYALASAGDAPDRDPRSWKLQGSSDGSSWTTLDTRTNQAFADRLETREYTVEKPQAFRYYRLAITENSGSDGTQLAEWLLSTTPAKRTPMATTLGSGPANAYDAKTQVGWTGMHALHLAGSQTAEGHGFAYNKVLDVDVPVGTDTQLSYELFPEASEKDQSYASTHVAVDLAFTDGTYLSQLGATDGHGFALDPQGQGDSKVLYVNQWNDVRSLIGTVAAGKTIDRILVGYDNTAGPADFSGWVDDIRVGDAPAANTSAHPSDHVLTTRGTNSSGDFSRGNTIPATAVPHGFNFWTPSTNSGSATWEYRYQQDNDSQNRPTIQSFNLSHEPSPWIGDRQTFQVMPSAQTGTPDASRSVRAETFSHENEVARPYYYGVTFDDGLKTEIAPTDHAAMFRFTFTGDESNVLLDNVNDDGGLTLDPKTGTLSGYTDVAAGNQSNGYKRMYVYATFDRPATAGAKLPTSGREKVSGYLTFDTSKTRTVEMRIATSLIGVAQAKRNLGLEIADGDTFEQVRDRAQALWDAKLGVVDVEGATDDQLTTLYSNLYRLNLYPNSGYENTGTAASPVWKHVDQSGTSLDPAPDGTTATHTGADVVDGKVYVDNGFWDTYRTTWPAYSLLYPDDAAEMVDGMTQEYADGGWVSRWSAPGYANSMTGTSSDVAFADAFVKGVDINVRRAYEASLKNASVAPPNENVGRKGQEQATFLGYTPSSTHESASWSLEDYLNDYGIAMMSKKLRDSTDASDPDHQEYADNYEYYLNRSLDYVTLFDPETGFFRAKDASGDWAQAASDFDPRAWGSPYTETDAWNFAFHAVQDPQGLANLYGGRDKLADKLDEFFATPETAQYPGAYGGVIHEMREAKAVRMGQWGLSNQVSHHIPYLYDAVGQPSKTQAIVREALARGFVGSEIGQGYPGDEDNGEMSGWQLFSSLGFYPLQVGTPTYAIGSPLFTKATIHLANGKDLVVSAPENSATNVYVQGVTVNGKAQSSTYLTQDQLTAGGTIVFDMGPTPSSWGTGAKDGLPSVTQDGRVPDPLADVTGPKAGKAASDDADAKVSALFDNTSATGATFSSATPKVSYALSSRTARVTMYTLTSAAAKGTDPTAWKLQGSLDGKTWVTLDTRTGERFSERQQTRAFSVAHPGIYRQYRVAVTSSQAATTALSEVELLAHTPRVSELADVVTKARQDRSIPERTAKDLGALVAAAQKAEDAGDADAVKAQVRALKVAMDGMPQSLLPDDVRAQLELVVSQWIGDGEGLDLVRTQVGELTRSGDIIGGVSHTLVDLIDQAQAASDGNHAAPLAKALEDLRSAIAGAKDNKVSKAAKAALLPLVDQLIASPPSTVRATSAAAVLMSDYDPGKAWWPSSWWNSAVATQTVVEYMQRTGDRSYLAQVDRTFEQDKGTFPAGQLSGDELLGNFTSRAIDDSEWWGLAWVQAYDLTGDQKYLDMATKIGEYVDGYWDTSTCGGGVWWDAERTYKNAVTNGLWVRLTAELHNRIKGDTTWLARSQAGWDWITSSGMINAKGLVNDGLDATCQNNGGTVWTYNQGVFLGGGLELYKATGDASVLKTVRKLADAGTTDPELVTDGILTEECDPAGTCDDNAKQFKGIFLRYVGDLNDTLKDHPYQAFVDRQAGSVWAHDRNRDDRLGLRWAGGSGTQKANTFDWRTQASALSALLAAIPAKEA